MRRLQTTAAHSAETCISQGFVTEHDFSRANKPTELKGASQAAEKLIKGGFVEGHDFSHADKANRMNGALAPEVRFPRISSQSRPFPAACSAPEVCFLSLRRYNWRLSAAFTLIFLVANVELHPQSNPLIDTGQVTVDGRQIAYRIRNLPINAFPDLPRPIADALEAKGCVIPQTYQAKRPENVIHGSFERSGSDDWAVLCSSKGVVSLLVFFSDGKVNEPEIVASANLTTRAQAHDSTGDLGFNWGIDTATPKQVHEAQAGMLHRPTPPPYDCVADTTLGGNTHYRLFWQGAWGQIDSGVD